MGPLITGWHSVSTQKHPISSTGSLVAYGMCNPESDDNAGDICVGLVGSGTNARPSSFPHKHRREIVHRCLSPHFLLLEVPRTSD